MRVNLIAGNIKNLKIRLHIEDLHLSATVLGLRVPISFEAIIKHKITITLKDCSAIFQAAISIRIGEISSMPCGVINHEITIGLHHYTHAGNLQGIWRIQRNVFLGKSRLRRRRVIVAAPSARAQQNE